VGARGKRRGYHHVRKIRSKKRTGFKKDQGGGKGPKVTKSNKVPKDENPWTFWV